MKNCLIYIRKVKESKIFQVGILWASFASVLIFYGALIPLLPVFVQAWSGTELKSPTNFINNSSETNQTQSKSRELNSVITGSLVSLAQWTEFGTNFMVGPLADKIGYDVPLFIGYFIVVVSSIGFAFANSYATLIIWRALEGVGAAFVITSGTAIIAEMFSDDHKLRTKMIGIALCGLSIGLMIGPPFGSVLYEVGEKYAPFLVIAGLTFVIALLQLWVRKPKIHTRQNSEPRATVTAQLRLIRDPYVLMCTLLIWIGYLGPSFLEGILPLYMMTELGAKTWMTGTVFVPLNIAFAVVLPIILWTSGRVGRWPIIVLSFVLGAIGLGGYGFLKSFTAQLILGIPIGIQVAGLDSIIFPLMAYLVDTRVREAVYGSAFALTNIATSLAFATGPIIAGGLMTAIGFNGSIFVAAGITVAGLIPLGILRKTINSSYEGKEGEGDRLLPEGNANGIKNDNSEE